MKANRHSLIGKDTRAQVGIGTMIVFIATILVAATAAAVLIDTSGKLQERSSSTGNQATDQVASNLILKGAYGWRSGGDVLTLNFTIALAPGAATVDLNQTEIVIDNGAKKIQLDHAPANNGFADSFYISEIRDPQNTITDASPVMTPGSLLNVQVNLTNADNAAGMTLGARKEVGVLILPEVGSPLHADFTTPASYGSDSVIILR